MMTIHMADLVIINKSGRGMVVQGMFVTMAIITMGGEMPRTPVVIVACIKSQGSTEMRHIIMGATMMLAVEGKILEAGLDIRDGGNLRYEGKGGDNWNVVKSMVRGSNRYQRRKGISRVANRSVVKGIVWGNNKNVVKCLVRGGNKNVVEGIVRGNLRNVAKGMVILDTRAEVEGVVSGFKRDVVVSTVMM